MRRWKVVNRVQAYRRGKGGPTNTNMIINDFYNNYCVKRN